MKKKIATLLIAGLLTTNCVSCGNETVSEFSNCDYDYAIVYCPDGNVEKIRIRTWFDCANGQVEFVSEDGNIYRVNSVNCILVRQNQ